jgi:hypothetical protein
MAPEIPRAQAEAVLAVLARAEVLGQVPAAVLVVAVLVVAPAVAQAADQDGSLTAAWPCVSAAMACDRKPICRATP